MYYTYQSADIIKPGIEAISKPFAIMPYCQLAMNYCLEHCIRLEPSRTAQTAIVVVFIYIGDLNDLQLQACGDLRDLKAPCPCDVQALHS